MRRMIAAAVLMTWFSPVGTLAQTMQLTPLQQRVEERRMLRAESHRRSPTILRTEITPEESRELIASPAMWSEARRVQRMLEKNPTTLKKWRQEIIDRTNVIRKEEGLSVVTYNRLLERAAQKHAEDMVKRRYVSHLSPEGQTHTQRIMAEKYGDIDEETCGCSRYSIAYGENIGWGQTEPWKVMHDWMASEGHRVNLLNENFDEIGVGIYGNVWVQNFGGIHIEKY